MFAEHSTADLSLCFDYIHSCSFFACQKMKIHQNRLLTETESDTVFIKNTYRHKNMMRLHGCFALWDHRGRLWRISRCTTVKVKEKITDVWVVSNMKLHMQFEVTFPVFGQYICRAQQVLISESMIADSCCCGSILFIRLLFLLPNSHGSSSSGSSSLGLSGMLRQT